MLNQLHTHEWCHIMRGVEELNIVNRANVSAAKNLTAWLHHPIPIQTTRGINLTTRRTCKFLFIWDRQTWHDHQISLIVSPVIRMKKWLYNNNQVIRRFRWMPHSITTNRVQLPPMTREVAPTYHVKRGLLWNVTFACIRENMIWFRIWTNRWCESVYIRLVLIILLGSDSSKHFYWFTLYT